MLLWVWSLTTTLPQTSLTLTSLEARPGDKSSYVAEWASKHCAFHPPNLSPELLDLPPGASRSRRQEQEASSPRGTTSSLSGTRRKLPATPHSQPACSPEVGLSTFLLLAAPYLLATTCTHCSGVLQALAFTPDSSLSPPRQDDSEDDGTGFMTHTQVGSYSYSYCYRCHPSSSTWWMWWRPE